MKTCNNGDHHKEADVVVVWDDWKGTPCALCAALTEIYDLTCKIEELEAKIKDLETQDQSEGGAHDGMR